MLSFVEILIQGLHYHLTVFAVAQKICVADVYENSLYVVLTDIIRIGLLDIEQVFIGNTLLIGAIPFPYIPLQPADRGVQVNKDIGFYQLGMDDLEQLLI